ncbi:hypothetical protein BH11ACT6_BH11ACT6_16760 [soil metagenome]
MGWVEARWRRVERAQQWPGIATPILSAVTAGACFLLGGVLVLSLATLEPSNFSAPGVAYTNASIACAVGIGVLLWRKLLRPWQFNLLVFTATVLITTTVFVAATPGATVSLATLYGFVAFSAFFLPWQQAAAHIVLAGVACLCVLGAASTVPWWSAMIPTVTTAAMGTVIALLGRLVSKSEQDSDTGVPNRRGFDRILGLGIADALHGAAQPTVVVLRLEGLVDIDDRLGSRAGHQLLLGVLESWRGVLSDDHLLARVGDAEFAVLLPAATEQDGVALSHRLRAVTSPDCSAGVTSSQPGESVSMVLSRAEFALRRAKRKGRNLTVVESASVPSLAAELANAIAANAVEVLYQPIVTLDDGNAIVGVEALARWAPPHRPDMAISEVITIAENSNLIAELDRYVLHRACLDVQWMQQQRDGTSLTLTANVSGLDLIEKGYAATVAETLAATGWPAQRLVLEVTESVVDVDTPAAIAALHELRTHGIRVAIDDFGTGYSTLSRLQTLPIDLLKLDASFTARTALDPSCAPPPLLQAIAALAGALDLPVIIEGVETETQATALQRAGFSMAQGYHFGRPQVREDMLDLLTVGLR